jgi:hypothetical protein
MKMPAILLAAAVWAGAFLSGGPADAASDAAVAPLAFDERIEKIIASTKYLNEIRYELFNSPLLQEVQKHPKRFLPEVESYLHRSPNAPMNNVMIAVLGMQCLDLHEYLGFLDRLARAPKGRMSPWALFYGVVPGIDWSKRLALRYREHAVRATLKRVAASPNADDRLRNAVIHILDGMSGKSYKDDPEGPALKCGTEVTDRRKSAASAPDK